MIYLDNAATTKPSRAALDGMRAAEEFFANPSSTHFAGLSAAKFLAGCREQVAHAMGLRRLENRMGADRVILTASGTEANNLSLLGAAYAKKRDPNRPGTILLAAGEHPSMENPALRLESEGYDLVRIPTTGGVLDLDALTDALQNPPSPVLYFGCMRVNNETGAVYDVSAAAKLVRKYAPGAVIHCDDVQGFGKIKDSPDRLGVDTLSVSAHKIHGTRGAGALYIRGELDRQKKLVPVMPGGGQEFGYRSGTENLFAIAAFAAAATEAIRDFSAHRETESALRARLLAHLSVIDGVETHIPPAHTEGIVHLSLPGIRSEIMLNYLSGREICVSAGSACSAHGRHASAALTAYGLDARAMDTAIRVSLDYTNTAEEIDAFADALADGVRTLQRLR